MEFYVAEARADPFAVLKWRLRTIKSLNFICANCAATEFIEMHHVRHIKTINVKLDPFSKMMAAVNRKQVPPVLFLIYFIIA